MAQFMVEECPNTAGMTQEASLTKAVEDASTAEEPPKLSAESRAFVGAISGELHIDGYVVAPKFAAIDSYVLFIAAAFATAGEGDAIKEDVMRYATGEITCDEFLAAWHARYLEICK